MFIVFAFNCYYPEGGVHDIRLATDNYCEAVDKFNSLQSEWDYVQVYDTRTQDTVLEHMV